MSQYETLKECVATRGGVVVERAHSKAAVKQKLRLSGKQASAYDIISVPKTVDEESADYADPQEDSSV